MEETTTSTNVKSASFSNSGITKFEGIIEISFMDKLRLSLLDVFTQLDRSAQKMSFLYTVITAIRFMQLIGPTFMVANNNLWNENSIGAKVITFISISYQIFPKWVYLGNEHIILYAISAFQLLVFVYICTVALHYKATVKITNISKHLITLYMSCFSYTLPNVTITFIGLLLTSLFTGKYPANATNICAIVFSLIVIFLYTWLVTVCYNFALTFRRSSLLSIESSTQNIVCIITIIQSFILMLLSDLKEIVQVVMLVIALIPNAFLMLKVIFSSTFIYESHEALILSGTIFNTIFLIAANISINVGLKWNELTLLVIVASLVLLYYISLFFVKKLRFKYLTILDDFEATKDFSVIGSVRKYEAVLATGFNYSHPVCIDYSLFTSVTDEFPNEPIVWMVFAKFAAIYPENSDKLVYIANCLAKSGNRNSKITTTNYLIGTIIKTRESNLTPFLKAKIAKLTKISSKTKSKLRNIWNLVLQCNVNEMDSATHAAYVSTLENQTEIEHLVNLFPNNRFVARIYSRFFLEIMADTANQKIWKDNVIALQRGTLISADPIQNLGLEAFPSIPLRVQETRVIAQVNSMQQEDFSDEFLSEDKENSNIALASLIKNRRFKSTQFIYFSTILCFIFLILIPSVILVLIFPSYKSKLERPLVFMYSISYVRNILNMIPAFTFDVIAANVIDPQQTNRTIMPKMIFPDDFPMDSYGGRRDALNITLYLIQEVVGINEMVYGLMDYEKGNEKLDQARDALFKKILNFTVYKRGDKKSVILSSAEEIVTKVAEQASKVMAFETFDRDSLFSPEGKTVTLNSDSPTVKMNYALMLMTEYIKENDIKFQALYTYICVGLCIFSSIVYIIIFVFQIKKLSNQKLEIFKTMTTLPKTVISQVASSFTTINKEKFENSSTTNTETSSGDMNKQEENTIKVFNSISEEGFHSSALVNGLMFAIFIITCIVSFYFITDTYKVVSRTVIESSPHINNMLGSSAYLFSMLTKLFKLSVDQYDPSFNGVVESIEEEVESIKTKQVAMFKYFNDMRFGGSGKREFPFVGMEDALHHANKILSCKDPYKPPKNFLEGGLCFDSEGVIYLTTSFMKKYSESMSKGQFVKPRSENLIYVWQLGIVMEYQAFFYPAASKIVDTIITDVSKNFPIMLSASIVCIVISLIASIVIISIGKEAEKYMRFSLTQFLQCPTKAIYASPKVMTLLTGDSKVSIFDDATQRDSDFFNSIISKLNDIVVIAKAEDFMIIDANIAFEKTFDASHDEVVGTNLKDFLEKTEIEGAGIDDIITKQCDIVVNKGTDKIYMTSRSLTFSGIIVLIGRNQTTRVMHQRLIDEEKAKSDTMLSSILPPSLVPRVQSGEKNISFAVQSVSVLFFDIVEFTPWCGSNQASYVMKMLNTIFKEMDALIATHKTLSKIKYIGDCYMAGGGIFDEVNQPAVHTKEMVEFGIEAIRKLREINEIHNEKLRIRVGINTGGPIIAGVLGTEKPTFEILGPTINVAQQMEHHGVPMMVHISRSVYELIYGTNFTIKERGEIEVKNGKMFTYLVDPGQGSNNNY